MWFKTLTTYQFSDGFTLTGAQLEARLKESAFHQCGPHDSASYGFVPALGRRTKALVHQANGCMLIRTRKEEKILPPAVINEKLQERIEEIEDEQDRQVFAKEKKMLKDDLIMELLPQVLTQSRYFYAYIDLVSGLLVVNGSLSQAEELTSQLREALGSLPITNPSVKYMPCDVMHGWLDTGELPEALALGDQCDLREPGDDGSQIKAQKMDLTSQPIHNHLDGMLVTSLALEWGDSLTFTLKDNLQITNVAMTDVLEAERDTVETDSKLEALDADFALMTGTFRKFLPQLISYLN